MIVKIAVSMAAINSDLSTLPRRWTCEAAMKVRLPFNRIDAVIGFIVLAGAVLAAIMIHRSGGVVCFDNTDLGITTRRRYASIRPTTR